MPLVTSKELLLRAREEHFALGAFNAMNMETVQAILTAAEAERAPVILQVSQGALRYAGLDYLVAIIRVAAQSSPIPVVLHLDHGADFEHNALCLRAGFTSLMYDGSQEPFERNVEITRKICEMAHAVGLPVEAEIGHVGGSEDGLDEEEVEALMTDPGDAQRFVELTGVDSVAISVGSVHRMRHQEARLDLERISAIKERVRVPLVLHGGTGVPDDMVREAVQRGICKVNVATELGRSFLRGISSALQAKPEEMDPRPILSVAKQEVTEAVRAKIRLFGSSGKA